MLWSQNWHYVQFGYSLSNEKYFLKRRLNTARNPDAYRFDAIYGNTGRQGRWMWKLANKTDNEAAKCYEWYDRQPSASFMNIIRNHGPSDCPCSLSQISSDRRYRVSSIIDGNILCYKQRVTWFTYSSISFHTTCCYERDDGSLSNVITPESGPTTQRYITTKYRWWRILYYWWVRAESRVKAVADDKKAFEFCCAKSPLCHLYEDKRPIPDCSRYTPPVLGSFYFIQYFKCQEFER